jgi:hypothetical protein
MDTPNDSTRDQPSPGSARYLLTQDGALVEQAAS